MNTAIKILIVLSLLSKVIGKVMKSQHVEHANFAVILSYLFFIATIVLLTLQLHKEYPIYSVILLLSGLATAGMLLKKYHISGAGLLVVLGLVAEFIFVYTLIRNKLLRTSIFHFLLGLSFLIGWVLICMEISYEAWGYSSKFISYPIVAFSGTILLNKQAFNLGEKNVLIFVCVHGLVFIFNTLFGLLI